MEQKKWLLLVCMFIILITPTNAEISETAHFDFENTLTDNIQSITGVSIGNGYYDNLDAPVYSTSGDGGISFAFPDEESKINLTSVGTDLGIGTHDSGDHWSFSIWAKQDTQSDSHFILNDDNNKVRLRFDNTAIIGNCYGNTVSGGSVITTLDWYLLTFSFDGTKCTVSYTPEGGSTSSFDITKGSSNPSNIFYIGYSEETPFSLQGNVDEAKFYNHSLNSTLIDSILQTGSIPFTGEPLLGVDHNLTIYSNNVPYYFEYDNTSNKGYEYFTLNNTGLINTSCKTSNCYQGSNTHYYPTTTFKDSSNAFIFSTYIKGNITTNSSLLTINSNQSEYMILGITENREPFIKGVSHNDTYEYIFNEGSPINFSRWEHISYKYNRYGINAPSLEIYVNGTQYDNQFYSSSFTALTDDFNGSIYSIVFNEESYFVDDSILYVNSEINYSDMKYFNEQILYYSEEGIDQQIYPILPPINITIYSVCDEIVTLASNITENRTFNWSEAIDLQYLTVTYNVKIGSLYLINETLSTSFDYEFSSPPFIDNTYTSEVMACNPYECASDTCTFDICISNFVPEYSTCISNEQTKTYTDANNCPITYNVPTDNNTIVGCVNEDLNAEIESDRENLMLVLLFVIIALLCVLQLLGSNSLVGITAGILNVLAISSLFFFTPVEYVIIPIIGLLLQVALFFFVLIKNLDK